jgi:hypothetical protein
MGCTLLSLLFLAKSTEAQEWKIVGSEQDLASEASSYTSIVTVTDGAATITYVAFTESNIAKVRKFDGESWTVVGGNVSTGNAAFTKIYVDETGKLYVTYVDAANGNRLAVASYNPVSDLWEPLNNNPDNLYVSDETVSYSISQFNSTPRSSLAFDAGNVPYIFYGEGAGLTPSVKKFNGTAWEIVGGTPVSSQRAIAPSIAIDDSNIPYVVYMNQATATTTTGNLVVYRFQNNVWEPIIVPSPVPGGSSTTGATTAVRHTCISFTSDWNPVVSYFNASNSNRATIIIYNKTSGTWSLSGIISSRDITNNSLVRDPSGNLFASFTDVISNGSGRSVARVSKLAVGTTAWTPLRNGDGTDIDEPAGNLSVAINGAATPYVVYTKANSSSIVTPIVRVLVAGVPPITTPPDPDEVVNTPYQMERLDRGLVAVRSNSNQVFIGWRLFGTDSAGIAFNIYRNGIKINETPVTNSTNYIDNVSENGSYTIKAVLNGVEQTSSRQTQVWAQNFLDIPLQKPEGGTTPDGVAYTYTANDCSVGDLDGDGEYDIVLKWDPTNSKDNSQSGYTGNVYLDAYKLNGTRLWRIDLGRNIRAGAHYTQFMVYDLDGDGKAEVACKTADGTVDGAGVTIGDPLADFRNTAGYVLSGPEFLTIFNGQTGAAMATTNYLPARGTVNSWGDNYGNRVDRFIAAIAYVDGARPSLIMGRGYYTRLVRAAWDWRQGQLTLRWIFDSNNPGNNLYAGQGNHQMTVGDVDADGKQEVFNGSSGVNDNGNGLWSNGMGHGDALHMTDMDPDRPGMEIWQPYEYPPGNGSVGAALVDAKTGARIFTVSEASADVGRGLAADIDPRYKGYEMWAARGGLYTCKGVQIGTVKPSMNFAIWWDGDLSRELLDGTTISKWDYTTSTLSPILSATGASSNNGTKATPGLSADILGDWREEVIFRTSDNNNLRIYTTTIPTEHRFYTLMHDPQYRVAIAWQNSAYNQPPHPGFYLGNEMNAAPVPNMEYVTDIIPPIALAKNITVTLNEGKAIITAADIDNGSYDAFGIGSLQISKDSFDCSNIGANEVVLTVTDINNNTATATAIVTVTGNLPEKPQILVSRINNTYTGVDDKTIILGYGAQELIFTATGPDQGQNLYQWSPATYLNAANIVSPIFTPVSAGDFKYTVTATNGYGCTAVADTVSIKVIDARCGKNNDKVVVCHKGKELCIDGSAVQAHLAHGDRIGDCNGPNSTLLTLIDAIKDIINGSACKVDVYPNPLQDHARISVTLGKAGNYSLQLFDVRGTVIRVLSTGERDKGEFFYELNAVDLVKGLYFVKLQTETKVITKAILIL